MFFETLENRSLFSVSLSAGVLTVTGTNLADAITINKNGAGQLAVNDNGSLHNYGWGSVSQIIVNALDGSDNVSSNDAVTKPMVIHGGEGNDNLRSGGAVDVITGDNGNDWIDGGLLPDDMFGGPGTDSVSYADRLFGINVTLDDVANDGKVVTGPKDNCHSDIENVYGTNYADTITGSSVNNYLVGNGGDDNLFGNGGTADILEGNAGNDHLSLGTGNGSALGGEGADYVTGGSGPGINFLYGDAGNDSIYGYGYQNVMRGGPGEDYLNSFGTNTSWIYGEEGNDTAWGGSGQNVICGGDGNDKLHGWSANTNWLHGEAGDDEIWAATGSSVVYGGDGNDIIRGGGSGTNWLYGDAGNDNVIGGSTGSSYIYGGADNDKVYAGRGYSSMNGDAGDDVLVSIGGSHSDIVRGGTGFDSFWVDSEATEQLPDVNFIEAILGTVHRVGSFGNGASRERLAQDITDPTDSGTVATFSDRPLFASDGPTKDDVFQGSVGDCYFLATLGATAKTDPNRIRQSVVELGDGTYAVQFWNGNTPVFQRVDGELPTSAGSPRFAGLGHQNANWVAIMEKAYTHHRTGANTYASIASGWMNEVFNDLHSTSTDLWSWSNGTSLLNHIQSELSAGKAVTIGTPSTIAAGAPLVGLHAYMVERVNFTTVYIPFIGSITMPYSVTLRNPWGYDGAGSDSNTADAYVTVTATQANTSFSGVISAFV